MEFLELKMRRIAPLVVMCCLIGVGSQVTQAQTSGALLSVTGNAGTAVNFNIYDSQIHSGTVQQPPCDLNYPTDAYVLQGGSWTGQDCGDAYEVTDNNSNLPHQNFGKADVAKFHIETHYLLQTSVNITGASLSDGLVTYNYTLTSGANLQPGETINIAGMTPPGNNGTFTIISVSEGSFTVSNPSGGNAVDQSGTGTVRICNTSGTICTTAGGPDSGFLTVKNNTGSAFTGTITLQGISPIAGGSFCPASVVEGGPGVASDSWTSGLAAGASVTLALGSQGTVGSPKGADSSNCGGFNQPLGPYNLVAGNKIRFIMGDSTLLQTDPTGHIAGLIDEFDLTPATATNGDTLQVLPVPVPAGPLMDAGGHINPLGQHFGSETAAFPFIAGSRFTADNFPTQASIPVESLSAVGNPVGLELKLICKPGNTAANDCETFLWTGNLWFHVDPNSYGDNKIGGTHVLGTHLFDCATTKFDFDSFISYTDGPLHHGNSCYAGTFDPTATPIVGTFYTKTLVGFGFPVEDDDWNLVFKGQRIGLSFQAFDFSGVTPVTNLTLCANSDGTGCIKPWVNIQILPITCQKGDRNVLTLFDFEFERGLENEGGGKYEYILNTPKNPPYSCFTPVFTFSSGPSIYFDGTNQTNTARFQFLQF